jgi:cytochrome c oxidase subunit 1
LAPSNPWQAQTLDWQTATPVPLTNFPVLPVVTKLPYDYGVPDPLSPEKLEEQYEEKVGAPS